MSIKFVYYESSLMILLASFQVLWNWWNTENWWISMRLLFSRLLCGYSTSRQWNIFSGSVNKNVAFSPVSENLEAAFWWHYALIPNVIFSRRGSVGRASSPESCGCGFKSHLWQDFCLCPLWHTRSVRNYPTSASAERATPKPHSLIINEHHNIFLIYKAHW